MERQDEVPTAAQGVQELIERIRGEGVKTGREEAERILREARGQAASLRASAEAEAREMVERARAQIAREQAAGVEALKNAARDAALTLRGNVRASFERYVQRLVSTDMQDAAFVRSLVLVLAGEAAARYIADQDAEILVSSALAGAADAASPSAAVREKIRSAVLGAAGAMLREGLELLPADDVASGARVRLVGQDLEIDLTDKAVTRLLLKHLLPRYRAIVEDLEPLR
jgi:V/A-type H+-transporting ATPase subunit E